MYTKNCPTCGKEMRYTRENNLNASIRHNCECSSCAMRRTHVGREPWNKGKTGLQVAWNKGLTKETNEIVRKYANAVTETLTGRKLSNEHIKNIRMSTLKNIKNNLKSGFQVTPNYNPDACRIINEYGEKNGYNFQHAMNGGEFYIKELGYWVDGYDKNKNVVIEYLEPAHKYNIKLLKDIQRKKEIIEFLNCEFIEIKEWE